MKRRFALVLLMALLATSSEGQSTPVGDVVTLPFTLLGDITGELEVSFEEAESLSPANLGASAQLTSPLTLLGRLPAGVSLPLGFPVLVRIEPPPAGGLAFQGVTAIRLGGTSLGAPANARLFSAPLGGPFQDITSFVEEVQDLRGMTTYRVLGTSGGFSEFLIVQDSRPVSNVIAAKLDRLESLLAAHAGTMPVALQADLASRLGAVRSSSAPGNEEAALQELEGFIQVVEAHAGIDLPDLWRAQRDLVNVAGRLKAAAETLRYSLWIRQAGS